MTFSCNSSVRGIGCRHTNRGSCRVCDARHVGFSRFAALTANPNLKTSVSVGGFGTGTHSDDHGERQRSVLQQHSGLPWLRQTDGPGAVFAVAGRLDHRRRRHRGIHQGDRGRALQGGQPGRRRCHRGGHQRAGGPRISVRVRRRRGELCGVARRSRPRPRCAGGDRHLGQGRSRPGDAGCAGTPRQSGRRAWMSASPGSARRQICPMRCFPAAASAGPKPP